MMSSIRVTVITTTLLLALAPFAMAQTGTTNPPAAPQAGSGTTTAPAGMSQMTQRDLVNKLEGRGYDDVSDIHQQGNAWMAKAKKDGRMVNIEVDENGHVMEH